MTERQPNRFALEVYDLVAKIPKGRIMTYGQIAALCGSPRSARIVGQIAHWGPLELPWQRVVNKNGGLAAGYTTGGREAHKRDLEADGITVSQVYTVDVNNLIWWPDEGAHARAPYPLVVIVGPTASGKTALAINLAKKFNSEIIAADSRTIYKGMDIGTAMPTLTERQEAPHHLLNLIEPSSRFTAAEFKRLAGTTADLIHEQGKLPIIVGGTGLYIDAYLYDYSFSSSNEGGKDGSSARSSLRPSTLLIGINIERPILKQRIAGRVDEMIANGLVDEVRQLLSQYGADAPGLKDAGYQAVIQHIDGKIDFNEMQRLLIKSHLSLAKRQMTWFRRNQDINWISRNDEAEQLVSDFLKSL